MDERDKSELPPMAERRPAQRRRVVWRGRCAWLDGSRSFDCTIRDRSETGARIVIQGAQMVPQRFYLIDRTNRTAHEVKVAWNDGKQLGLQFVNSFDIDAIKSRELAFLKGLAM
jgi:PilZ domain